MVYEFYAWVMYLHYLASHINCLYILLSQILLFPYLCSGYFICMCSFEVSQKLPSLNYSGVCLVCDMLVAVVNVCVCTMSLYPPLLLSLIALTTDSSLPVTRK